MGSSISNSLSGAALQIERARLALLSGQTMSETMILALSKTLDKSSFADIRNYELVPEIGGARLRLRDMIQLDQRVSEGWVRTWGRILVSLGRFMRGETSEDLVVPDTAAVGLVRALGPRLFKPSYLYPKERCSTLSLRSYDVRAASLRRWMSWWRMETKSQLPRSSMVRRQLCCSRCGLMMWRH